MAWGNCGTDSNGRLIGYAQEAICDHPGCDAKIDRGLAHACGGMHGDCGGQACERYFCEKHLNSVDSDAMDYHELQGPICDECLAEAKEDIASRIVAGDARIVDDADAP